MRTRALLLFVTAAFALTGCATGKDETARDVITAPDAGSPQSGSADASTSILEQNGAAPTSLPVTTSSTGSTMPSVPTTVAVVQSTTTVAAPETTEDTAAENVYAYAAAEAIAERANEDGLDGLDADELVLALETASEAAYEIEFPTIVETLDVRISRDGTSVTIETGAITDDGNETGKAYVCVSAGRATPQQAPCGGN